MKNKKLDRYYVKDKLGEGGFGQVYHGWDQQLHRDVAIKVLPADKLSLLEGQILAKFDHPNVVQLYDIIPANQSHYLIMEYVPGPSLLEQQLSLTDILNLAIQICEGLDYIHQDGLVHQDIKPHNILRDPRTGVCKLTDFGLVARISNGEKTIVGTPKYIAPEQREGKVVNNRADIYGLSQVVSVLLEKNQIETVPAQLRRILAKAGQKDYRKRYDNVLALKGELQQLLFSLPKWDALEHVIPQIRVRFPWDYALGIINGVIASLTIYALLHNNFIVNCDLYPQIFKVWIAPLMAGIVGFLSLPLAGVLIFVLLFPPLLISWPSFGLVYGLLILLLVPKIYRYPLVFLISCLLAIWDGAFVWLIPILAGYHYGITSGVIGAILLPLIKFISQELPSLQGYQEVLLSPNSISEGSWLVMGFQRVSLSEIYELIELGLSWFYTPEITIVILGVLMGIGANIVGRRGKLGIVLYFLATGMAVIYTMPELLWQWLVVMLILVSTIRLLHVRQVSDNKTKLITISPY